MSWEEFYLLETNEQISPHLSPPPPPSPPLPPLSPDLQDFDWDTTLQFLPASDSKRLEKKPGRRKKLWVGVGLLLSSAAVALLTGLLVWHFHCELVLTTFI